jgi:hypothetical protein
MDSSLVGIYIHAKCGRGARMPRLGWPIERFPVDEASWRKEMTSSGVSAELNAERRELVWDVGVNMST